MLVKGKIPEGLQVLASKNARDHDSLMPASVSFRVHHDSGYPAVSVCKWMHLSYKKHRKDHFQHYPVDADDVAFLLAALNGAASHLVTYDEHLKDVGVFYPEFITCEPVAFLSDLRATLTP